MASKSPDGSPTRFRLDKDDGGKGDGEVIEFDDVLRDLPGRRVSGRATWHGRDVFVKVRFGGPSALRRIEAEANVARVVAERGFATPKVLGVMRCRAVTNSEPDDGDASTATSSGAALVLEWIDAAPLSTALDPRLAPADAAPPLRSLVGLMARLHDAGLNQTDLHFENFLVTDPKVHSADVRSTASSYSDASDESALHREDDLIILDSDRITVRARSVSRRAALANIFSLLAQITPAWDDLVPDLARAYATTRTTCFRLPSDAALRRGQARARRERDRRFLAKILRDSRRTVVKETSTAKIVISRPWATDAELERRLVDIAETDPASFRDDLQTGLRRVQLDDESSHDDVDPESDTNFAFDVAETTFVVHAFSPTRRRLRSRGNDATDDAVQAWFHSHRRPDFGLVRSAPVALIRSTPRGARTTAYLVVQPRTPRSQ